MLVCGCVRESSHRQPSLSSRPPPLLDPHICGHVFPFSIPDPQGIGEMPSSPDPRPPIFFEILCGLLLSSGDPGARGGDVELHARRRLDVFCRSTSICTVAVVPTSRRPVVGLCPV